MQVMHVLSAAPRNCAKYVICDSCLLLAHSRMPAHTSAAGVPVRFRRRASQLWCAHPAADLGVQICLAYEGGRVLLTEIEMLLTRIAR